MIFKTGNEIIYTGNGIISPTSRPLMKKGPFPNVSLLRNSKLLFKTGNGTGKGIIFPNYRLHIKNPFKFTKEFKIDF